MRVQFYPEVMVQVIMCDFNLEWSHKTKDLSDVDIPDYLQRMRQRGFTNLTNAPLLCVRLLKQDETCHLCFLTIHHAVLDAWSIDMVLVEVQQVYHGLKLCTAPVPYGRYLEHTMKISPAQSQSFWETYLQGVEPTPDLPLPKSGTNPVESVTEQLNIPLKSMQAWCGKLDITVNSLVRGLCALLLGRYLGQDTREVTFGAMVTGCDGDIDGIDEIVGPTVNTLSFRIKLDRTHPIHAWLQNIHTQSGTLMDHGHVGLLDIEAWANQKPLFQSMLINTKSRSKGFDSTLDNTYNYLRWVVKGGYNQVNFPLTLGFSEQQDDDGLVVKITGKHGSAYYSSMMAYLNTVLETLVHETQPMDPLTVDSLMASVPPPEMQRIQTWSQGSHLITLGKTESQLDTIALESLNHSLTLTYRELINGSQLVAHLLTALDSPNRFFILLFQREPAFVLSMLGTLRTGKFAVPMNTSQASERLFGMCETLILQDDELVYSLGKVDACMLTPSMLQAVGDPSNYPNLRMVATIGEPLPHQHICVCDGYWNHEQRTQDVFVPNPLGSGLMYRTGDLGCWLPDGRVSCMGRKDSQVKLRGFRVELGEVESAVYSANSHIQHAVALVKQGQLVVYFTSTDQRLVSITELRESLSRSLPSFMVPDYVVPIAEIPHTSNGKVDRKQLTALALAKMDDSATHIQYDFSPTDKVMFTRLQNLVKEILQLPDDHHPIHPGSSFLKLGGDSITTIQLSGRSKRELGLNLNVQDICHHQGILGALIKYVGRSSVLSMVPVNISVDTTRYPCTPLQAGMILAITKDPAAYIMQVRFTVGIALDKARFQQAWFLVVKNNPTLRTRFEYDKPNEQWMQVAMEHIELEWQSFTDIETYLVQDCQRGFIVDGPFIRFGYHPYKHQCVLTMHHSITDGWSSGLAFEQVIDIYQRLTDGKAVPSGGADGYAQFAHYVTSQSIGTAREFWQHELEGMIEVSGHNVPVPNVDRIVGLCINTIPYRVTLEKHQTMESLIESVHQGNIRTHGYDCYPLSDVYKWSGFPANQAMFNTLLVVENLPFQSGGDLDLQLESVYNPTEYPLSVVVFPAQDQLEGIMNYHASKFTAIFVQQMLDDFVHTLRSILIDPSKSLVNLPARLSELDSLIQTPTDCQPRHARYFVEQQIQRTPGHVTLHDLSNGQEFTYRVSDKMSRYMAWLLLSAVESSCVNSDQVVGIVAKNSLGLVVAQLAIWKLGLAFVVIDPEYPVDRIQFIVSDTQCFAWIGYGCEPPCSVLSDLPWISLDSLSTSLLSTDPLLPLPRITIDPHDLAYVVYTSGSTGQPKGALVEHDNLANHINGYHLSTLNITRHTISPTLLASTFDAAIGETWTPLSFGAMVLLTHQKADFERAFRMATQVSTTPSLLSNFDPREFSRLRNVVMGGEPAELPLIRKWQQGGIPKVVNVYGPCETTVVSHFKIFSEDHLAKDISIGQPLPGCKSIILDSWMTLMPVGAIGELWIGGRGVARGYLHREELTRERFVDTPTWGRLYRTGDLARWLPNGDVEILGRVDNQVKVRGFRVELEKVERAILASVTGVSRASVAYDREKKILVGFVTPKDVNVDQVLDALQDRVPHYMIPNIIVPLGDFPLSHNDKTDREALLVLPQRSSVEQDTHVLTPMETKLVTVLADIFGINPATVSPHNDTFFTLGGNSISAMHFVSRCKNNGIRLELMDINRRTTISTLAKRACEETDKPIADI
ncbi:Nonribosomal peptide synthetase [Dispira simplex]|nr:Nonribosomal peptide synthetase [Dispira simplex]